MPNRRDFFRTMAGAAAGAVALGGGLTTASRLLAQAPGGGRRELSIGGRRVRVIDVHAHCVVPVQDIVKGTPFEKNGGGGGNQIIGPMRIAQMDKAGIDMQALSINGFWWWATDRDSPRVSAELTTRGWRRSSARIPIGSWRSPRWRCSTPTSPPSSSRTP